MRPRSCPFALAIVLATAPAAWAHDALVAHEPSQAAPAPAPQAPVQARPGWTNDDAPRTDQTVDVVKGTRLVLNSHAGEVTVRAWDRDAVRVQASHGTRDRVDVQTADSTLRVRTRSSRGPGGPVDYILTVPRWMAVNLSGTYLTATIEGTSAEVSVETVGGDLTLKGGSGAVSLRSIEGEIKVDGASGKVNASTVNDSITLNAVSGDVIAETVNGDVTVTAAKASSLEVSTVNGDVRFEGPVTGAGTYRVTTHQGDIRVSLGQNAGATVFVRTFRGDFSSDFPITLPKSDTDRGKNDNNVRFNFTLGSGSARVELQSFQGDIHVAKGPLRARERGREREREREHHMAGLSSTLERSIERAMGAIEPVIEAHAERLAVNVEAAVDAHVDDAVDVGLAVLGDLLRQMAPPAPPAPRAPRAPGAPEPPSAPEAMLAPPAPPAPPAPAPLPRPRR